MGSATASGTAPASRQLRARCAELRPKGCSTDGTATGLAFQTRCGADGGPEDAKQVPPFFQISVVLALRFTRQENENPSPRPAYATRFSFFSSAGKASGSFSPFTHQLLPSYCLFQDREKPKLNRCRVFKCPSLDGKTVLLLLCFFSRKPTAISASPSAK